MEPFPLKKGETVNFAAIISSEAVTTLIISVNSVEIGRSGDNEFSKNLGKAEDLIGKTFLAYIRGYGKSGDFNQIIKQSKVILNINSNSFQHEYSPLITQVKKLMFDSYIVIKFIEA